MMNISKKVKIYECSIKLESRMYTRKATDDSIHGFKV